jgi:hypothetical protein
MCDSDIINFLHTRKIIHYACGASLTIDTPYNEVIKRRIQILNASEKCLGYTNGYFKNLKIVKEELRNKNFPLKIQFENGKLIDLNQLDFNLLENAKTITVNEKSSLTLKDVSGDESYSDFLYCKKCSKGFSEQIYHCCECNNEFDTQH